jgi:hypothetical protein
VSFIADICFFRDLMASGCLTSNVLRNAVSRHIVLILIDGLEALSSIEQCLELRRFSSK